MAPRSIMLFVSISCLPIFAAAHPGPTVALGEATAAVDVAPDDPATWLRRAELWLDVGAIDAARADLARAAELAAGDEPAARRSRRLRIRLALSAGELDTAARLARDGLATHDDPAVWRLLAEAEHRRGDLAASARAFEHLLARTARPSPDLVLAAIDVLEALDRPAAALDRLTMALDRVGPAPALVERAESLARTLGRPVPPRPSTVASPWPSVVGARGATPTLTRGPYLQRATPTGVVVRWRTDVATIGRVRFGVDGGPLDQVTDGGGVTTEHAVDLAGLQPSTRYAYRLETIEGDILSAAPDPTFRTSPAGSTPPGSTRVWVLGDSGTANADARAVRDAFLAWNGGPEADLLLMLGDNAYPDGTDAEYQAALFDTYPTILARIPVWPTLGNHDAASADSATQSGVYYDLFTLPTAGEAGGVPSATEAYYSFDHGGVHFVCLDSHDSSRAPGGAMLTWLAADLAANTAEWTIAYWHHPPYTKGSHDSDVEGRLVEMRENVLPVLEASGVDLVLTGHSHSYERSVLLHEHHGASSSLEPSMIVDSGDGDPAGSGAYSTVSSASAGAVYAVAGSSGRVTPAPLDHPAMVVSLAELGSMVLDIDGPRLDATFLDATGGVLDTFRLEHTAAIFADDFESGTLGAWAD